ncbi:MAG: hypothetical protein LBQ66_06900 [Planctomycetaceae bacterium]|nr:hypothetical protein [Planctomycetaceae bacterium]
MDKIIVALEQTKKSIFDNESLFLRYDRLGCEDLLRSQFSGGDIPVKWELAWKKDKFYAKRTYCPTDAQKKDNSVIITEEPSVLILKNRKLLNWSKGFSKCDIEIFSGFVTLNLIKEWTIFEFLGYNVAEKILTTSGNDYQKTCEQTKDEPAFYFLSLPYLPETLREHQTDYHIKPTRDNIDNHLCWVIGRTSSDTIWIDDNFRIRKRLLYDQLYKNSIKYVINYRDHREIKPNIWIPLTLSIDIYANPFVEPEVNWGKVAKRWTIKISEFEINQVPDNLFDVTPDVGTLVQDFDKNERYRIVKKGSDPFAGPIAQGITANRYVVYRAIFITLGSFLILLYFWLKFRERRE